MNVFIISPGRTGTKTLSSALSLLDGYTSAHESRVNKLGNDRINYPANHIECDNRLVWFLPRLTKKYGKNSILVIINRDKKKIAESYNKRWYKINMMKAYSQGILLRDLSQNNILVCHDYVNNVYEFLEYFSKDWYKVIHIDIDAPELGLKELLRLLNREKYYEKVINYIKNNKENLNKKNIKHKISVLYFNLRNLIYDLMRN